MASVPQGVAANVWITDISMIPNNIWVHYENLLNASELERFSSMIDYNHKKLYLVSRVLLKSALANEMGISPHAVRLRQTKYGKPIVHECHNRPSLSFNLSNTAGLVTIVIGSDMDVGIDVENIDRSFDFSEIATTVLSTVEMQKYNKDTFIPRERFYKIWTMKEAYLKAIGVGLHVPLPYVTFEFSGKDPALLETPQALTRSRPWIFKQHMYKKSHLIALAISPYQDGTHLNINFKLCVLLNDTSTWTPKKFFEM